MKTHPVRSDRYLAPDGARSHLSHPAAVSLVLLLLLYPRFGSADTPASNTHQPMFRRSKTSAAVTTWRDRTLTYSDVLLSTVVAELNRHNRHQIRLEGPVPNAMRLSCSTDAGYPLGLLLFLMAEPSLIVQPDGEDWVVRGREVALDERE